jgi:hypothetical protein
MSDFRLAPGTGIVFSLFRVEPHSPGVCVLTFHASNELGHEFFAAAIVNGRSPVRMSASFSIFIWGTVRCLEPPMPPACWRT